MSKLTPDSIRVNIHFGLFWGCFLWAIAFLFLIALDFMGVINFKEFSFKDILLSSEAFFSIVAFLVGALGFIYSLICSIILLFIKN
jgi:hypothetical protein